MDLKEKLTSLKKTIPLLSNSETVADRIEASEAVGYNKALSDVIELLANPNTFSVHSELKKVNKMTKTDEIRKGTYILKQIIRFHKCYTCHNLKKWEATEINVTEFVKRCGKCQK